MKQPASSVTCTGCGRDAEFGRLRICAHCRLAEELTDLFDDGTGNIAAPLQPLLEALSRQKNPRSARTWLTVNCHAAQLLRDIAQGKSPLTHETFQNHPYPEKVAFLRELCIEHELLDPVNLDIERFQDWLKAKTNALDNQDARLISQYARWVHLHRMRHLENTGKLKTGTFLAAKQSTTMAIGFLQHLRTRGRSPQDCTQHDIDEWLAGGPTTRSLARGFVRWATQHGHLPVLEFPYRTAKSSPMISQTQRLAHIAALIGPAAENLGAERIAALFLLLYGQSLSRISCMTLDRIDDTEGRLTVSFTGDRLEIPAPFDTLVRAHLSALPNTNTAAHRQNTWLFPGTRPGQHLHQGTIMNRLRARGINLLGARNASLRALVLEMPAPVVADSFNYSHSVTNRHRREAGAVFSPYIKHRSTNY